MRKPIVHRAPSKPSSQIKTFGYDAATSTLGMTFTRGPGNEYQYPNFPATKFAELEKADATGESLGVFFGVNVKSLPFEKFGPVA
ncbi:MAG: KTSC domain-containing protein [Myxococcaceae bacterium]|nr:MAG: KTSC domain-containing protein [Myxococcaceae bacterium]